MDISTHQASSNDNSTGQLTSQASFMANPKIVQESDYVQFKRFLDNDVFMDRWTASEQDRYVSGPLFRWDWGEPGDHRDR
jgi:hypothetical protein